MAAGAVDEAVNESGKCANSPPLLRRGVSRPFNSFTPMTAQFFILFGIG
jgi:hypothetical protein